MPDFHQPIPVYLTSRRNFIRLTLFTAVFALVFINVYAPFGVDVWFHVTRWQLFFYSSLVILTGMLVIVISRILMYYVSRKTPVTYLGYSVWILAEIFFMALFYALYVKYFLHDARYLPDLVKVSVQNTALVLLLPYSLMWLYLSYLDKKTRLSAMAEGQPVAESLKLMVPFTDEKGVLRISLKMENLLYLESSDNYVNIFHISDAKVSRFMLRNTLKNLEEQFKGTGVVRCHRSYMVNCNKVRIIRRENEGLRLEMDVPGQLDIPVTKTFIENVMKAFAHYSPAGND